MPVRSFTVFQDSPAEIPQIDREGPQSAISAPATDTTATLVSTLAAIEKENLHPVTGERAGPALCSDGKKRKTAALSTKLLVDPSSKKQKELKSESTKKQRKPLSSSGKPKGSDGRKSSNKKQRSSRRTSPLPPVQEEGDTRREPACLVSQASIDSRCYELTVSPLADVSEAYETISQSDPDDVRERFVMVLLCSTDSELQEQVIKQSESHSPTEKQDTSQRSFTQDVTTPKHVSSAFTFSSPSPSSERFRRAQSSPTHCTNHAD
ncbi:hypothetical protein ID866_334 [Astraeus odoratus]|nr:hypothetical protein ID866_334 [Astraeus odoratus]